MRILIVGLGSMGKRRIRLLKQIDSSARITGVDAKEERRKEAEILFNIQTISALQLAFHSNKYDCVFVCTSPLSHANIIESCLMHEINVFTEINLVNDKYISVNSLVFNTIFVSKS